FGAEPRAFGARLGPKSPQTGGVSISTVRPLGPRTLRLAITPCALSHDLPFDIGFPNGALSTARKIKLISPCPTRMGVVTLEDKQVGVDHSVYLRPSLAWTALRRVK
ncbi:MAG TPA: hypothetical protein VNK89_04760, partial [Thermoflexus sp.]|nr:hypothetical protein [Thermoflexus sp.]